MVLFNSYSPEERLSVVRKLVEAGAPLNIKDNDGYTALDYAKKYKFTEVIAYLISQGAQE